MSGCGGPAYSCRRCRRPRCPCRRVRGSCGCRGWQRTGNGALWRRPRRPARERRRGLWSFLLLQVPQLAREHAAAERAIVDAGELPTLAAEYEEVLGVDLGDDGSVGEAMRLGVLDVPAVHQPLHCVAAAHWMVLA